MVVYQIKKKHNIPVFFEWYHWNLDINIRIKLKVLAYRLAIVTGILSIPCCDFKEFIYFFFQENLCKRININRTSFNFFSFVVDMDYLHIILILIF